MIALFFLGLLVLSATGQYNVQSGGVPVESTACQVGFDCVNKGICVNGVIDPSGGSLITQRVKVTVCGGQNTCCRIPGYVEPLGQDQCKFNEDCVSYKICSRDGIIDVSGGSLLDTRTKIPPSTCVNYEFPDVSAVCCLRPYKCPEFQKCVDTNHCGINGLIDTTGNLQTYLQNGIKCISDDKKINGVCCAQGAEIKDNLPVPLKCGIRNNKNLNKHVQTGYGKEDANFGEFPWQAIIFLSSDKNELLFKCAGTLISDRHILTAAHCVYLLTPSAIGVRLGEYEVSSVKELKPYIDRTVSKIYVHPKYVEGRTVYNLAIIELYDPVKLDFHVFPICMPHKTQKFTKCVTTGWGKDHYDGDYQHILKKLELPYVDHEWCQGLLRKTPLSKYFQLDVSLACAGGEEGKDACTGDGGGPLACLDVTTGQYYLAGIVNAGLKCGIKDVPGLYANVPYMIDWVNDIIATSGGHASSLPNYSG